MTFDGAVQSDGGPDLGWLAGMVGALPVNVLATDRDLRLIYLNPMAEQTVRDLDPEIRRLFRVGTDELLGGSIQRMHADPAKVERIQRGSRRLPHQATLFGKAALRAVFARCHVERIIDAGRGWR